MFEEFGGFFGWLLIASFAATLLNYVIKFVSKKWGKKINANAFGKKLMKLLFTIFVKNHKYFGFLAAASLLIHFIIQFSDAGLNFTGGLAAALLLFQVGLGVYANVKHKPRKGTWFVLHRVIAVLIVAGIALHLLAPYAINNLVNNNSSVQLESVDTSNLPVFTAAELATYNGQNGQKAYVAYDGVVYDVTNNSRWQNGMHEGNKAGTDLTDAFSASPHGIKVLENLTVVGTLK